MVKPPSPLPTTCTWCQSQSSQTLYPTHDIFGNHFEIHRCLTCNTVFLSPPPDDQLLAQAYDDSYYGEGTEKFKNSWIEKLLDQFRHRRATLLARRIGNSGRVLDIGCGNGRFLQFIAMKGTIEIHGIEMPGNSAERAKQIPGIHLKIKKLQVDDYPNNFFDAISLVHVYEHLTDPSDTIKVIHQILRPGGFLYLSFPNIDSWQSRFFKGSWLHLDPPRHLFFQSVKTLDKLLEPFGFEKIREQHFNPEYNPFGAQQSLLNCVIKDREVLYESLKGNTLYVAPYKGFSLWWQQWFFRLSAPVFIVTDFVAALFKKSATVELMYQKKG